MHTLTRPAAPAVLAKYVGGRDTWDEFWRDHHDHYEQVRHALEAMQGGLCAYCEDTLGNNWHVEHMWPRASFNARTFDWNNLYGSCTRLECCGEFKDAGGRPYQPDGLIDPARDDPDEFLVFVEDGTVHARSGLSPTGRTKAVETIRVLNLNAPTLVQRRARTVRSVLDTEPDILEIVATCPPEERRDWFCELIEICQVHCFHTPIRHLFAL